MRHGSNRIQKVENYLKIIYNHAQLAENKTISTKKIYFGHPLFVMILN
jgi:hypothetical protein